MQTMYILNKCMIEEQDRWYSKTISDAVLGDPRKMSLYVSRLGAKYYDVQIWNFEIVWLIVGLNMILDDTFM